MKLQRYWMGCLSAVIGSYDHRLFCHCSYWTLQGLVIASVYWRH